MINECLNDFFDRTELDSYFNQESPNKMPPLLICQDKLKQQNDDILNYNLLYQEAIRSKPNNPQEPFSNMNNSYLNKPDNCILPINVRSQSNAASLQEGYSKNIDVESELKRINFYNDKCFKDNYKLNPSTFECHTRIFNKQNNGLSYMRDMVVV